MTEPLPNSPAAASIVRVWDLPTRLFHWALLVCVAALFLTAYVPGASIDWHSRLGYLMLTLLLFRLGWGVIGGHWSRFVHFVPAPRHLLSYLRGRIRGQEWLGHSPVGGAAIIAMLAALLAQVGTGLIIDDEIAFTGPFNRFVSNALGVSARAWHAGWGQWLLVGLVALHGAAILFYLLVKKDNLIAPMLHGDKRTVTWARASQDTPASRLLALAWLGLCAAVVYLALAVAG